MQPSPQIYTFLSTVVSPLFTGNTFQDTPHWMPETSDSTKPYKYCFFLYMHTYGSLIYKSGAVRD